MAAAKSFQEPADSSDDLRLLGLGLNESEKAIIACTPVVLNKAIYDRFFALGICGPAVNGASVFEALAHDTVIFLPGDRFEFARDLRDATGCTLAIIIPAQDEFGDVIDLVALDLEAGEIATWRGEAAMLGAHELSAPCGEPTIVHKTALDWLCAGREGLVIIDPVMARSRLAGRQLVVKDIAFGILLRSELRSGCEIVLRKPCDATI